MHDALGYIPYREASAARVASPCAQAGSQQPTRRRKRKG